MIVFPHLILKKENQILLTRRSTAQKLWPGHWHCVTGSIENGESPRDTIIREAEEEIGITPQNPILNTTIFLTEKDYFDPLQKFYGLELFFVSYLRGDQNPINCEPLKQDALGWFDIDRLPQPFIPGVAFGLKSYFDNQNYAEFYHV